MRRSRGFIYLGMIVMLITGSSCVTQKQNTAESQNTQDKTSGRRIKIGFSMATLKEERWQRDRDAFLAHCKELDVDCVVTVANSDASRQENDVENLLTNGVDVLVIAPQNATQAVSMVEKAK